MSSVLTAAAVPVEAVGAGATAWVLAATALVALMVPGVALLYGGMVSSRNVLSMLMQSLVTAAAVGVAWILVGYSLAFGSTGPLIGDLSLLGLTGLDSPVAGLEGTAAGTLPPPVHAAFQLMFAVVTAVLILGSTADRWRFGAFLPFMLIWPVLVYAPVAHWVFAPDGWAARSGALDFAGGTVVHVNAGAAALAMAVVLGRRRGWPESTPRPHSLPFVVLGAALLWVGWIGFNAGSAYGVGPVAGYALLNTHAGAAAGLFGWAVVERMRVGKVTTLGAASGVVAGLVAVTPCAGYVPPLAALAVSAVAGALCAGAVAITARFGIDDALDVVGVHLVAGIVGSLGVGLFASVAINPDGADGLFAGGDYTLLGVQALTVLAVAAYSFGATFLIGSVLDRIVGNRVTPAAERMGLDLALHGESAYVTDVPLVARHQATPNQAAPHQHAGDRS